LVPACGYTENWH